MSVVLQLVRSLFELFNLMDEFTQISGMQRIQENILSILFVVLYFPFQNGKWNF